VSDYIHPYIPFIPRIWGEEKNVKISKSILHVLSGSECVECVKTQAKPMLVCRLSGIMSTVFTKYPSFEQNVQNIEKI